jgi:Aldehyde dehydrogenase family
MANTGGMFMNARQPAALKMYIGGCWVESESGKPFEALNPAAGQVIATLPEGTREDTRWAITAANAASAEHRHVHLGPLPPLRAYC